MISVEEIKCDIMEITKEAKCRMTHKGARTLDEIIYMLEMENKHYRKKIENLKSKIEEVEKTKGEVKKELELEKEEGEKRIEFTDVDVKVVGDKIVVTEYDGTLLFITGIENVKKYEILEVR